MSPPTRIVVAHQAICLEELLLSGEFADCSVRVNGQKGVDAHSLILKWRVPYFHARERVEGAELKGELDLQIDGEDVTPVHLKCALRCAYGGQLVLSDATDFPALLALGKYLQMEAFCQELRAQAAEALGTSDALLELHAVRRITDQPLLEAAANADGFTITDAAHLPTLAELAVQAQAPSLLAACLAHTTYAAAPGMLAFAVETAVPHAVRYLLDLLVSAFAPTPRCADALGRLPPAVATAVLASDYLPLVRERDLVPFVDHLALYMARNAPYGPVRTLLARSVRSGAARLPSFDASDAAFSLPDAWQTIWTLNDTGSGGEVGGLCLTTGGTDRGDLHDWVVGVIALAAASAALVYRGACGDVIVRLTPQGVQAEWEVRQIRVLDRRQSAIDLTRRLSTSGSFAHASRSFDVRNLLDPSETKTWSAPLHSRDDCYLDASLPKALRPSQLLLTFPRLAERPTHIEMSVSRDGVGFVSAGVVKVPPTRTLPFDLSGIWGLIGEAESDVDDSDDGFDFDQT